MSSHEGVSCDNCKKNHIKGLRYKCLICYNFDLCQDCHLSSAEPESHKKDHPTQCILTRDDLDLYFSGELESWQKSYTCPYCGRCGLSEEALEEHVAREHSAEELDWDVQCPICAVAGVETGAREDFPGHLTSSHRFGRWSFLLVGIAYGSLWQSRYTSKELALKDVKTAEKAARDAKIAKEKQAAAAAELEGLNNMFK